MFKSSDNIDVRVFVFTGEKFVFMARDAKAFFEEFKQSIPYFEFSYTKELYDFTKLNDKVLLLDLLPLSLIVTYNFDVPTRLSMTFSNNKGRFFRRNFKTYWNSWKRTFYNDDRELEKAYELFKEGFIENKESGFDISPHLYEYNLDKNLSMPFSLLQPSYFVYIQVKDREGYWRDIFAGYTTFYGLEYQSANSYKISIDARGFSNMLRRIPVFADFGSGAFLQFILPKDDEIKKLFLIVYFTTFRKVGDVWKQNFISFQKLKDFMMFLISVLHYRMGLINLDNLQQDLIKFAKEATFISGLQEIDVEKEFKKIFENYKNYMQENPFKNGLYQSIVYYKGESNIRILNKNPFLKHSVFIPPELYDKDLLKEYYGDTFKTDSEIDGILEVFKKFISLSVMATPFHPNTYHLEGLIKKFTSNLGMFYSDDGMGNLVIDFIRYNQLPGLSFYKDHDDRYIIRMKEVLNYGFYENVENMRTAFYIESDINIPNANINEIVRESLFAGHSWADPRFLLRYGYRVDVMDGLYLNMNDGTYVKEFINAYSDAFLEFVNAREVSKITGLSLNQRPDLQLGRTIYFSHLEKLGIISGIQHNITLGNSFKTTLDVSFVHNIDYKLKEPRMVLIEYANKIKDNIAAQSLDSLVNAIVQENENDEYTEKTPCNLVRIPYDRFPADIDGSVKTLNPNFEGVSVINDKEVYVVKSFEKSGISYVDLDIRLFEVLKKVRENLEKKISKNAPVLAIPYLSSIWRFNEDTHSYKLNKRKNKYNSRHFYGRAIDVSAITFVVSEPQAFKDLLSYLKYVYELKEDLSFMDDLLNNSHLVKSFYDAIKGKPNYEDEKYLKYRKIYNTYLYDSIFFLKDYNSVYPDGLEFRYVKDILKSLDSQANSIFYSRYGGLKPSKMKDYVLFIRIPFRIIKPDGNYDRRKLLVYDFIDELLKVEDFVLSNKESYFDKNYIISCGGRNPEFDDNVRDCSWIRQHPELAYKGRDYYHVRHIHVSVGIPDCKDLRRAIL